ncbi:hypothetical protein HYS99_00755 [Candidatus Giovannonibacteria bacterium]|nr:hypothetical protein [Candidatus Giovannonibacteria bacterium]
MPELPEVEITKRKLEPLIVGRRVFGLGKILGIERRGKALMFYLSNNKALAIHQRMSGRILVVGRGEKNKYFRRRFKLSNGKDLVLHDVRKFGVVWYGKKDKILRENYFKTLGPDALAVSLKEFRNLLLPPSSPSQGKDKRITTPPLVKGRIGRGIKSFLLNQKNIAGIGNIMADEILWHAHIHPERKIATLTNSEIKNFWKSIRSVLNRSIKLGGSSMRDWMHPDNSRGGYFEKRSIYAREGESCKKCAQKILRKKINGRSAYFCENCQKKS